jgi:hypothetical protein
MTNPIIQAVLDHLPSKKRTSSGGWISFNAVCCTHRGETADKRGRGGVIVNPAGISYSCFNCGFKTGYTEGHILGMKFRKLMQWLSIDTQTIELLRFEAMRYHQEGAAEIVHVPRTQLLERDLPPGTKMLAGNENEFINHINYLQSRGYDINEFPFLGTHDTDDRMDRRVIIPFIVDNKIVGYTARLIEFGRPKYISQHDPACVFGISDQSYDAEWVTLTEGPMDAICLQGVATLGAEVRDEQADQIEALQKKVIVVPDRNVTGMSMSVDRPLSLLNSAIDYGWSVAFPNWEDDIVDVNQAVRRYGRLYVVRSILESATANPVTIKLKHKLGKYTEQEREHGV